MFLLANFNLKVRFIQFLNIFLKKRKLSLGSGIRNWVGWVMYDKLNYPLIKKINFTPTTKLPKNKFDIIFISHFFEHLDDKTFLNLLKEIKKISHIETKILIKIPNYEFFYKSFFNKNNFRFMKITNSNFLTYTHLWKRYKIEDNVYNRVSMMFCDYSNKYFKSQYQKDFEKKFNNLSYHGPARISEKKLKNIFKEKNFKQIQNNLKKEILKDKNFLRFNHINIWNFKNFINILKKNSFNIITTNKKKINNEFKYHIPSDEIHFLKSWSNYFYIKVNF
jgi:hypothetical protein